MHTLYQLRAVLRVDHKEDRKQGAVTLRVTSALGNSLIRRMYPLRHTRLSCRKCCREHSRKLVPSQPPDAQASMAFDLLLLETPLKSSGAQAK